MRSLGGSLAATLVTALCLTPVAAAQPDDHFQGIGRGGDTSGCDPMEFLLTVDRVNGEWIASLSPQYTPIETCPPWGFIVLGMVPAGVIYMLEGDWESGFRGPAATFLGWVEIGPYGDGQDIIAYGCTLPGDAYCWYASVTDIHAV